MLREQVLLEWENLKLRIDPDWTLAKRLGVSTNQILIVVCNVNISDLADSVRNLDPTARTFLSGGFVEEVD